MEKIVVKRGCVQVIVYTRQRTRSGRHSTEYIVDDRSGRDRKHHTFAKLEDAKAKAGEVAELIQRGEADVLKWSEGLRLELRKALEAVEPTGVSILPAAQLFAQAVRILGAKDDLLAACEHWKLHRPDKPLVRKTVDEAVTDYTASRAKRISVARKRTEQSYFKTFQAHCGSKLMHELVAEDIEAVVAANTWSPKTTRDFLTLVSCLFSHAEGRSWVPKGYNPTVEITRPRQPQRTIHIFEPWEAKKILVGLAAMQPDLVPMMALWLFSGARKEEIARLSWEQVNRGQETGFIELEGEQTKTGQGRLVPLATNLKKWLRLYRKETGTVVPAEWLQPTKTSENQISEITRLVRKKLGVVWRQNAPRHSFATFHFKVHRDVGATTLAMGTSLEQFQKHYWNKSQMVTKKMAAEWFAIVPDAAGVVVPITKADAPSTSATSAAAENFSVDKAIAASGV
jgi:integrase